MPRQPGKQPIEEVAAGSLQHAALRILDTCEMTATDLRLMLLLPDGMHHKGFLAQVVFPLQAQGLVELDSNATTWGTTDLGAAAAAKLGPFNDSSRLRGFADKEAAQAEPTLDHAPGCRPLPCRQRLAMGNADKMPPVPRPGSEQATKLPSRMGNRLHWPDGSVTAA